MLKKILQLIVVLLFTTSGVMAQTTVQITDVDATPGEEISVPVIMDSNGDDIVAITWWIEFDSDLMDFVRIENEAFTNGFWSANYNAGVDKIGITYFDGGSGSSISGTVLLDLVFAYKGGFSSTISFDEINCEVQKTGGITVSVTYDSGLLTQLGSDGAISMAPITGTVGNTVTMPVTIDGTEPATSFSSVDAITLVISYDPTQLTYVDLVNPFMSGFNANPPVNGLLTITWSGTAQDFSDLQTLFNLQFVYLGGTADVAFVPGCEIVNSPTILPVTYTDGTVSAAAAVADLTISEVAGTADDAVSVPIVASDFTGIQTGGPVVLEISYDDTKLTYTGYTTSQLSGWSVANISSGHVSMQCINSAGDAIIDGDLAALNFIYIGGGLANVAFEPGTQVQTNNSVNVPVNLVDGFVDLAYTVSGVLKYANTTGGVRPITNSTVYLMSSDGLTEIANTTTDGSGNYTFVDVFAGDYMLDAATTKAWGGVNILDALVLRFQSASFISGTMKFLAADVNQTNSVNILDALIVRSYVQTLVKPLPAWSADDWLFENPSISVIAVDVVQDIQGICSGDANATYIPTP